MGRAGETIVSTPFVGVLLALLTWPLASSTPSVGPDASWVAGLYMALGDGLQFGTEFVFAYGPLGFLQQPVLYDQELWTIAILYRAAVYVALAIALLWSARRWLPLLPAATLVYALLVVGYLEAAAVLLAFLVCIAALAEDPPPRAPNLVAVGGAILAAVELLAKLNFGIAILALCLLTLLAVPERRRNYTLFTAVFGVSLLAGWLIAGQSPGNLPAFVSNSIQVLGGYSQAMAANVSDASWQRPYAVAAAILLILAAATPDGPPSRRLARAGLAGLLGFAMFKQSFVRQGLGNAMDFFPLMLGAAIGIAWQLPVRVRRLPPLTPALLLIVPLAAVSVAALPRPSLWDALQPGDHVEYLRQDLQAIASADERDRLQEDGRSSMTSTYRLDRSTLALVEGREVATLPWEIGVAWAYDLDWLPLPVIQDYQAYTPPLDALNVEALAGEDRPAAILRQNTTVFGSLSDASIDGRLDAWDPPAAAREMLCHYRAIRTTRRWQVLYPTAERCRRPRLLGSVAVRTGRPIAIPPPPPGSVVFARIEGLEVEGLESLRTFLYRARQRWATVNGETSWRVVPATLGDGLILRADPRVDFPAPFALAPQARTLSFRLAGSDRIVRIRFYAQHVGPDKLPDQRIFS